MMYHDVVYTQGNTDRFLTQTSQVTNLSSSSSESEAVFSVALRCANVGCQAHLTRLFALDVGKSANFKLKLAEQTRQRLFESLSKHS